MQSKGAQNASIPERAIAGCDLISRQERRKQLEGRPNTLNTRLAAEGQDWSLPPKLAQYSKGAVSTWKRHSIKVPPGGAEWGLRAGLFAESA